MIKRIAFSIFLLSSLITHADTTCIEEENGTCTKYEETEDDLFPYPSVSWGKNKLDKWMQIYISAKKSSDTITGRLVVENGGGPSFDLKNECSVTKRNSEKLITSFSCKSEGQTPLAGTTYKVIRTNRDACGDKPYMILKCIKGCNKNSVPPVFNIHSTECPDPENG